MLAATLLALAQPAAPLQPVGKWSVDYGENRCLLARPYGDPARPVQMGFEVDVKGTVAELLLILPAELAPARVRGNGYIALAPAAELIPVRYVKQPFDAKRVSLVVAPDRALTSAITKASALSLELGGPPLTLALTAVGKALAAATACNDDLLQHWGVDPVTMMDLPPELKASWITPGDYPAHSMRASEEGVATAIVTFASDGAVAACRVVRTSGFPELDRATCAVPRKRARLPRVETPAARQLFWRVRWILPG